MDDNTILWPASPPADIVLDHEGVHVWAMSLRVAGEPFRRLAAVLSREERQRAVSFRFDRDRNRFMTSHGMTRLILARYLGAQPAEIEFQPGAHGKPFLAGNGARDGLQFNLTHCQDLALLAVARDREVGIDLERVRPLEDASELAAHFCSQRENAEFQSLPPAEREAAFFRLWTCKEAWLKAVGDGIGTSLDKVEVAFATGETARYMNLPGGLATPAQDWNLLELTPVFGFVAALAITGPATHVGCWQWYGQALLEYAYD
jgi:4'-phosphopantetheinyl transferase